MAKSPTAQFNSIRRYTLLFLVFAIAFYLITDLPWFDTIRSPVLHFFASISAGVLSVLGYGTMAQVDIVSNVQFSVSIKEGCDALAPMILYTIAVIAYPVSLPQRLKGIAIGLTSLILLNVIRIVSLFMIGIHKSSWFDFMHVDFWQVLFIILTAMIWILWMRSVTVIRNQPTNA